MYDYLVVGAGLFGATFARVMTDAGKQCLVIDKRKHIAGNIFTEKKDDIYVHKYGPHIFHTSDEEIWKFVNKYAEFNTYTHRVKALYGDKYYTLPFSLKTFNEILGTHTPAALQEYLDSRERDDTNLETCAISLVGPEVYKILIKGYTEKQWGKKAVDLPASIIKRLPVRPTFDDNYFNDKYQGIPVNGYTEMVRAILKGIPFITDCEYSSSMNNIAKKIVYSGPIDEFFDYELGKLEYRSLDFVVEEYEQPFYQGCAQLNYTSSDVPFTRTVEHKHFTPDLKTDYTVVTREFPAQTGERFYPVGDDKNNKIYGEYKRLAQEKTPDIIFGGRLGNYKYYDMHQVIGQAMKYAKLEKGSNTTS